MIENLPAMQETLVQSLGHEDLLEEETATHSSILAWTIPWTEEPGGLQSTHSSVEGLTKHANLRSDLTAHTLLPHLLKDL